MHYPDEHIDSHIPSTSNCGKCEYDGEAEMKMHTQSDHIEKCKSLTCDHCNFTSKDECKHKTHICKVHILNPTFEDLYTKEGLDINGCTAIYSAKLKEDIIWLHSDRCWTNDHPCYWIPYNLQDKPVKPGDVRHFEVTKIVENGKICWSFLSEQMK